VKVALVGCGLIGGSLGLALRARGLTVIGQDRDPAAAERALALGALDAVGSGAGADVAVLAVPVRAIPEQAAALPALAPDAVITDVGSTKAAVVRAGEACFGGRFVGGHPMAGSERAGPDAADARLFEGRRVILTPSARTDADARARVAELWRLAGATVVEMDAERHDRLLAAVSHLPHAVAYALAASVGGLGADELRGLAGGGFTDTTRIAATPAPMWVDVFLENRARLLETLDAFSVELGALRAAIERGDGAAIAAHIDAARVARARILG
jgi:prephenate dehydrogenase